MSSSLALPQSAQDRLDAAVAAWPEEDRAELASAVAAALAGVECGSLPDATAHDSVRLAWAGQGLWLAEAPQPGESRFVFPDPERDLRELALEALRRRLSRRVSEGADAQSLTRAARTTARAIELAQEAIAERVELERTRTLAHDETPRVLRRERVLCLGDLPSDLTEAVFGQRALQEAWRGMDANVSEPSPRLPVDTALLSGELRERVLNAELPAAPQGVLILADNARGLRFVRDRYRGQVQCAYLDPPYNTGSGGRAYRDSLPRADWLCFMDERLALVKEALTEDGTVYAQIDQYEKERLRLLMDRHLDYVAEIVWRIGWVSGFKTRAKKWIRNHDTIYHYGRTSRPLFNKRYLPYPEGYLRRDGKPPTGKGIPLEDTWNCSETDRLDSIQIMSFSREKVGRGDLTQKNENLLARMLQASSNPNDLVLDPFLGSGTTAATAHKLGRRWVGIERSAEILREVILPRLKRVLLGDPYGISKEYEWAGGGSFEVLVLESSREARRRAEGLDS